MTTSVCSVCLVGDLRIKYIDNIELQNIFEKLTNLKAGAMCFLCYRLLQRCRRFADAARRAARLLAQLPQQGLEATEESLAMMKVERAPALALSLARSADLHTESVRHADSEPLQQQVYIKTEVAADDYSALETSEHPTEEDIFVEPLDTEPSALAVDDGGPAPSEDAPSDRAGARKRAVKSADAEPRVKKRRKARVGVKARTCEFCSKVFKRTSDLRVHRRVHTGEKPYACELCDKAFASSSTLIGHRSTHIPPHERPRPFACGRCHKSFRLKDTLQQHEKTHGERRFACSRCGKAFVLAAKLRQHAERHASERAHACDRCAKTFKTLGDLRHHMVVHSARRPHACAHCDKTFARGHDLTLHLRVHSGEKPYACGVCARAFSQSSSLAAHALTHSAERPFACDICGFRFKDKFSLAKHARAHAGGPPSACAVCGRECASRRGAQAHARSHSRAPAACAKCGKTFCDVSRMRRHERNVRCTAKDAPRPDQWDPLDGIPPPEKRI